MRTITIAAGFLVLSRAGLVCVLMLAYRHNQLSSLPRYKGPYTVAG